MLIDTRPTATRSAPALAIGALCAGLLAHPGAASADELAFRATASAAQEVQDPAVTSDGGARGTFTFTPSQSTLSASVHVRRLVGAVAAAHLHCNLAGANGPVVVDLDPTTGGMDGSIVDGLFTNDDIVPGCLDQCGFEVNNLASLRFAADEGCIYLNVHTDIYPGGEVRGQLLEK